MEKKVLKNPFKLQSSSNNDNIELETEHNNANANSPSQQQQQSTHFGLPPEPTDFMKKTGKIIAATAAIAGFIGGAGFADEGVVRFFGNVKKHPDYEKIKVFCEKYDSKIEILCPEEPLTDLGNVTLHPVRGRVPRRSVHGRVPRRSVRE